MPHFDPVHVVLRSVLLAGSAALIIESIVRMRAGRKGYWSVLGWALLIPVFLAWGYVSPRLHISAQWHNVSHSFRLLCVGAFVMYGIISLVPFLSRESKEMKAARRRAKQQAAQGEPTPLPPADAP